MINSYERDDEQAQGSHVPYLSGSFSEIETLILHF